MQILGFNKTQKFWVNLFLTKDKIVAFFFQRMNLTSKVAEL